MIQNEREGSLEQSSQSLENLLILIQNAQSKYHRYVHQHFSKQNSYRHNEQETTSKITENEMQQEIINCLTKYDQILTQESQVASKNNVNYAIDSLHDKLEKITHFIENSITINEFKTPIVCSFDLHLTKLIDGSILDLDNQHIRTGGKNSFEYAMILPDILHVQGYNHGQHCWRMYYRKNSYQPLFFGIYQMGIVPNNDITFRHEESCGLMSNGRIFCHGQTKNFKSCEFLYSYNENQIDMLVDFDNSFLSYKIVDDPEERECKFKTSFYPYTSKGIYYTVHLNFYWSSSATEAQIGKIDVNLFGKVQHLVAFPYQAWYG